MKRINIIGLAATLLLTGCRYEGTVDFNYQHPERYLTGDAVLEQHISKIDVDWYAGDIDFVYADLPGVHIYEESESLLNDTLRMRHYVDDEGTLNIQFCQNKTKLNSQRLKSLKKHLTIAVPRTMSLDEIEVEAVSSHVGIDSVLCRELTLEAVNMTLDARYPTLPGEITVEGVNCKVVLAVPPTAGLTIETSGVNNETTCELPVRKDGKTSIVGDGRCEVDIDAVNSSLTIKTT